MELVKLNEGVLELIVRLVRQLYCRTCKILPGRQYNCRPNNDLRYLIPGHPQLNVILSAYDAKSLHH